MWSGFHYAHNPPIEGLRHGGVAQNLRHSLTAFGSGWQGLLKEGPLSLAEQIVGRKLLGLSSHVDMPAPNAVRSYISKWEGKQSVETASNIFRDAEHQAGRQASLNAMKERIRHKALRNTEEGRQSFRTEFFKNLEAKHGISLPHAPVIEGLRHDGIQQHMRKGMTAFGSGWQGGLSDLKTARRVMASGVGSSPASSLPRMKSSSRGSRRMSRSL